MWRRLTIAALGLALLGAAPASARELSFLRAGQPMPGTEVPRIVDSYKRTVLLKGVNVDGIVDYWDADEAHPPPPEKLKPPYPNDPARYANGSCPKNNRRVEGVVACKFDFDQMRGLGYNVVRLNLSWSLLEPRPGRINARYIERIAQIVGWAKKKGIYVVLDMHQDAWSKYVYTRGESCTGEFRRIRGFDGAPLWASRYSFPSCAVNGVRELNPAVAEQFQKFWLNTDGLQDHYTNVLIALAQRFHDEPAVAGYELMNEPQPGFNAAPGESDAIHMFPYWGRAVDAVVARVKGFRQLFFVEPNVERNVTDTREAPPAPWSTYSKYRHVVYAPHIYTGVFTADQTVASERFQPMVSGYQAVQDDARALGLPLWIGEFGNNPRDDDTLLSQHYTLQDYFLLGGALWLWKENENDVNPGQFWGVYGPPFGPGVPQKKRILLTARATPIATAGNLQSVSYGPRGKRFDIRAVSGARIACGDRTHATIVFVPRGVSFRVDHARMTSFKRAGGHDVYVFPDGGARYRIHSGSGRKRTCPKS
ncbi:MAG TPA: cellulase family glycosylhydrolase [Thermoleophilaceae bacterium]|nr:cellulase family glycosylhydrolase [Thermoleophilaceae bacterium]